MERIVIVAYKPFPGKEMELKKLVANHWSILDKEKLVSPRQPIIMESLTQSVVEVFGWKSKEAMASAHDNPVVKKLWEEFSLVCDYIPISQVSEASNLFSEFTPLNS